MPIAVQHQYIRSTHVKVSSHIGRTGLQGTGGEGETLKSDKTPRKFKILIFMIKNYISYLDYNYNPGFDSFFKILLQNT
jgi:hypothetical protein